MRIAESRCAKKLLLIIEGLIKHKHTDEESAGNEAWCVSGSNFYLENKTLPFYHC